MNMPGKHPYKRRIPRNQRKPRHRSTSSQNPYDFVPKQPNSVIPADAGTKPKNPNRSVAARKPVPPKDDQLHNQRLFRANPNKFAKHVLGVEPWGKQRDILSAIAHNRKVAVRSCNGAGKTFTAAVAVLWWLMSYDNAIVITTAPSERQVKELLWREIRQLYMPRRDTIGGKLTRTRLDFASNRYAYGFSTNTEDRFQGFHSGNILVIVDEASGVDEFIYYAISGILTTQNAKLLLIGNPHGLAGTFYDAFHKNRKGYHTVHISAFDTPAFTEAGITAENIADLEYPDPVTRRGNPEKNKPRRSYHSRRQRVMPADPSFPRGRPRHSRGRGNPGKNKPRQFPHPPRTINASMGTQHL